MDWVGLKMPTGLSLVTECPYTLTHAPTSLEQAFIGFDSLGNLAWSRTGLWFQELSLDFR